ncbi:MAG: helix-turn-helix transcriptional regulator [bacterium]
MNKNNDFQKYLRENLKDVEFKKYFDEYGKQLEIAYQILQLRKKTKMSQKELAEKIGTTQSNIARMEAGQQNFTTNTLNKIASAFNLDLQVNFVKN